MIAGEKRKSERRRTGPRSATALTPSWRPCRHAVGGRGEVFRCTSLHAHIWEDSGIIVIMYSYHR